MRAYREDQIRLVMAEHSPANEGDCSCAWAVPSRNIHQEFTVDHLIDMLHLVDDAEETETLATIATEQFEAGIDADDAADGRWYAQANDLPYPDEGDD